MDESSGTRVVGAAILSESLMCASASPAMRDASPTSRVQFDVLVHLAHSMMLRLK